ncbi:Gfo/Idh/MocA family protein [Tissierella praeacuta]|uniref:Gfo/Idh/MocA family protein n=1 Tax=Tissierella praeacuta TaxID=43131 RepID=UPI000EC9EA8A|nr:Gfo/Idh/MocA family oxidoreductase [Tissierella praeacuta]MBU5255394.1 Gfo/Idh/MocA family oxidoreductase [Tissierella praeacuta]HAE91864.1 gfo/Idh/MocA family oxidoreductase [Tissierella sp.]
MRVAIVGAGFIAGVHVEELLNLGHEVVVAIGTDISRAESFAKKWDIPRFSINFDDALASDIDVVHICTPPTLHYEMVKKVLNSGKHVVCEKPLCLDPNEAKELMELANEKGLVNAVNFNVRFHDACTKIKTYIESNELGNINLIHGSYLQEFHVLPADYSWRYKEGLAGSMRATSEIGSHWIDLARYLTGLEIIEVSANYGKFNPTRYLKDNMMYENEEIGSQKIQVNSDDCAIVSLRFSNGAVGNMLLSEISHGRNNKLSIEISGTNKSIWWNTENPYTVNKAGKFTGVNMETNAFGGGFPSTFKNFFTEVYKDINLGSTNEEPKYPTFRDGYINSNVCNAIYQSANNNSIWIRV